MLLRESVFQIYKAVWLIMIMNRLDTISSLQWSSVNFIFVLELNIEACTDNIQRSEILHFIQVRNYGIVQLETFDVFNTGGGAMLESW